jgi:small multidrug resistance pump
VPTSPHRAARWLLVAAIVLEVTGTLSLRVSHGFSDLLPSAAALACYGLSMAVFSRGLTLGLSLGVGYGTLTSCGLAAATIAGTMLFHDSLHPGQVCGLALIGIGAVLLQAPRAGAPA